MAGVIGPGARPSDAFLSAFFPSFFQCVSSLCLLITRLQPPKLVIQQKGTRSLASVLCVLSRCTKIHRATALALFPVPWPGSLFPAHCLATSSSSPSFPTSESVSPAASLGGSACAFPCFVLLSLFGRVLLPSGFDGIACEVCMAVHLSCATVQSSDLGGCACDTEERLTCILRPLGKSPSPLFRATGWMAFSCRKRDGRLHELFCRPAAIE